MAEPGKVSNTVPIILLVVGIILIIAGGAMVGIYAHEEFDKKNAKTHHFYLIAGGAVLILVGFGMAIFGLIKISKNNKMKGAVGVGTEIEATAANPDADTAPLMDNAPSGSGYRGISSIPSPPRLPPGYASSPYAGYGYQPAPPQPMGYGMMPGYPGIVPGGYDYNNYTI